MIKITSKNLTKKSQTFLDEIEDVDWGDDPPPRGVVNDKNLDQYLTDDIEETPEVTQIGEDQPVQYPFMEETPMGRPGMVDPESEEIPYADSDQLVTDGIDNGEVISFDYTNRFGEYAGTRTVEPHYTFIAGTGNEVLVTFDRGQNDIRAFIVGNIHPNGVRYEGEHFEPRDEIMVGVSFGMGPGVY